jgi:signal transduction histidine kinase
MEETLKQLLAIALETNNCRIGAIHLVDPGANSLILICQQGLDDHQVARFESPNLENEIWTSLLFSSQPKVIPDISSDERFPEVIRQIGAGQFKAFVCAPVRANGIPVGLLSIFRESILDYSLEDITLLMTIAGQVGASVERKRLIDQAEQAAVIEERQRLARELHDSVTQLLYSQVLFASAGQKSIALGNLDPAKTFLNRIDEAALQALKEMRILVYELAPSEALKEGLLAALEHRLEAVEWRAGMIATIESDGKINLDENSELTLYRLIQEALNNTLKHSAASSVSINFHRHLDTLRVEIEDDGCGFDLHEKTRSGGMGISTMQERAGELGGELLIHTAPQQGTCIKISIKDLQ